MKIAIIGAGNVGGTLGKLWAQKGHEVVFGVRDPKDPKVQDQVKLAGRNSRAASVKEAASFGEVVVLATPWEAAQEAIQSAGSLAGKTLIDCINPLKPDLSGLAIGTNNSAGEEVARWATGAKVVKAFNTIGAPNFGNPKFGSESASMFICGNDPGAKATVTQLAADLGFEVVDAGPLGAARWLEALAMLWIHLAVKQGFGPTGHAFRLLRR
jgi:predicted dinucleotide-binding enzyme